MTSNNINPKSDSPFLIKEGMAKLLLLRFLVLLGIFHFSLTLYLFARPENFRSLYHLFLPLVLLVTLICEITLSRNKNGVKITALILFAALPLLLWNKLGRPELLYALINIVSAIVLINMISFFFKEMEGQIFEYQKKIGFIEADLKTISQETPFYETHLPNIKNQIHTQQRLSSFSRETGKLLEIDAIKKNLMFSLQNLFPTEAVTLRPPSLGQDPMDHWVTENKASLLCKDPSNDKRFVHFSPTRSKSVIATPLLIEKSLIGLVRIDSDVPNRFIETDLQQLELYTHIATLALENAQLFQKVTGMATQDGLTGLATHRIFQEKIQSEILRSARYHTHFSLIMLDIDHFKSVNDQYGHLVGDQVLKEFSQILTQFCAASDFPARYGGEEFTLILPETGMNEAHIRAENLRAAIESHIVQTPQYRFNITASLGCSSFPEDAQTANQIIRKADERLYRAKSSGRNRVVID